jgi:hypothetical protein
VISIDILCLANSYKHRGKCVAGLRVDGGGWIRPVARTTHGELYPVHYILDDGSCPQLYDLIRISFEGPTPLPHQPENWLIGSEPWQLVSRGLHKEFAPLLKAQLHSHPNLFGDSSSRISFDRFAGEPALSSLALIQPLKLSWVVNRTPENAHKARALFELGGTRYSLPVTDPTWIDKFRALPLGARPAEACAADPASTILLTISLGEPWEDGYCYKLASAIVPVPQCLLTAPEEPMAPAEAAWIIDALANGIDPYTGEPLTNAGPLTNSDTVKALRAASAALKGPPPEKKPRDLPQHAGKAWDPDEEEQLVREFEGGEPLAAIARAHGRTLGAIKSRLIRLGMIEV